MAQVEREPLVSRSWLIPAALAVVLVVLLAASAISWQHRRPEDAAPAMAVAAQESRNFFSLNSKTVDHNVDEVLALATGSFKKQYAARRDVIARDVRQRKLVVTATVPSDGVAIEYLSRSHARVLVAVDVRTLSGSDAVGKRFRSRLALRKVGGSWLVERLEQV